jgi:hypothetical protein
MIRKAWRRVATLLVSPGLAVGLLVFVGVWALLATFVAQGDATRPTVQSWAKAHSAIEPLVRALDLHAAFTSYLFVGAVLLLGVSTALCAWRRTRSAISRARTLRIAARDHALSHDGHHDIQISLSSKLSDAEVLSVASTALLRLGMKTDLQADRISAVSPSWTVWGSAIFHWALVVLIAVVLLGQMLRAEGSVPLAVGETKADEPASYLDVHAGPWHDWSRKRRSVRLDALAPDFKTGGIDRGAVPTVSLLDAAGEVIKTQRVYPNMMLHDGSLSINAPGVGLAVTLALLDANGAEVRRSIQLVDFSQSTTDGTVPIEAITRRDNAGNVLTRLRVTVPLERVDGHFGEWIPRRPKARLMVTSAEGTPLLDRIMSPGEAVPVPGGGEVRLVSIGWYSRLSIVDDPSIPFIYSAMIVAAVGLSMTLMLRQQLLVAGVVTGPDGPALVMNLRLWRNASTSRSEIERELTEALRRDQDGGTT